MALLLAKTNYGLVQGLPSDNQAVSAFKGIPFAKPPVGELRWRAPQPPEPWQGVRKAYAFEPIPYQPRQKPGSTTQREFYPVDWPRGEDCLYLNVWTSAQSADERLPVALWIYGGGFHRGYANKQETDGDGFAKRGCVYVNFNYRLSSLGFLAHPALAQEAPYGSSGNYGLLDQIAALKWVYENIAAFGGDPERITIFGQSAGGISVKCLMASALSRAYVSGAIIESGCGMTPLGNRTMPADRAAHEAMGEKFFAFLGVKTLAQAREIDADTLFDKSQAFLRANPGLHFWPCLDGYALSEEPGDTLRRGDHPEIPCMIGYNKDESSFSIAGESYPPEMYTPDGFERVMRARMGAHANELLPLIDHATPEAIENFLRWPLYLMMVPGTNAFAEVFSEKLNSPLYMYVFTHTPPGEPNVGVYHSAEKMYIHETIHRNWRPMTGEDYMLARDMADYWANFVKYHNPNGAGLPEWTPFTPAQRRYMNLKPGCEMQTLTETPFLSRYREILREENYSF